jgi:hypothetical protein
MFMMSTGARSPVWVDRESQFAADAEEERCFMQLRDIVMSGYDVCGEGMLGRR